MAQENMVSVEFTDAEIQDIENALATIDGIFRGKLKNLTAQQRQQYGRVKYEKEIFIDKAARYMEQLMDMIPNWLDYAEFKRDYDAHKKLSGLIAKVEALLNKLQDTNLLLGYDLDTAALAFYQNVKMGAKMNALGARTAYDDMKQQFPGSPGKKTENPKL